MAAAQQPENPYGDGLVSEFADFVEWEEYWDVDLGREWNERLRDYWRRCAPAEPTHYEPIRERNEAERVARQNARAAAAGLVADLTLAEWGAVLARFGFRCAYCDVEGSLAMDHVVSIARGGGTTRGNVVPACRPCNRAKGTRAVPMPTPRAS